MRIENPSQPDSGRSLLRPAKAFSLEAYPAIQQGKENYYWQHQHQLQILALRFDQGSRTLPEKSRLLQAEAKPSGQEKPQMQPRENFAANEPRREKEKTFSAPLQTSLFLSDGSLFCRTRPLSAGVGSEKGSTRLIPDLTKKRDPASPRTCLPAASTLLKKYRLLPEKNSGEYSLHLKTGNLDTLSTLRLALKNFCQKQGFRLKTLVINGVQQP